MRINIFFDSGGGAGIAVDPEGKQWLNEHPQEKERLIKQAGEEIKTPRGRSLGVGRFCFRFDPQIEVKETDVGGWWDARESPMEYYSRLKCEIL
jgi:hypothetical protein